HNAGGFGTLDDDDRFGSALAGVADVNSDGVEDLVVGAAGDDDGGPQRGAVYVLFLTQTGTVSGFQKISQTSGGFGLSLNNLGGFGSAIESIGDQDGNGVPDLAIGASAAPGSGRAFVAFLDAAGTSLNAVEIPEAALALGDRFGAGLAFLGDLGADGDVELAVGAPAHDEGGRNRGAFWTYSLDINPPLAAGVTAWLWGADAGTGSLMRADLAAAGLLPAAQPYNATPWSYAGSESVASHSARSVDWVLVRLYAENTPDEIAASAAGMLDTTGSVRDAVTNEALRFNVSPGPYYVSIEHRNHKPVRTAQPVLFDTFAEVDFTLSETSAGVNASYETPYGFYALWPGNSIGSATLDALDALDWRLMAGQSSVYTRADFNLDGDVDAADLLGLWLPANGR
ncbi:MAG: integrin alpha, partial [Bacteroidota bacterium]